MLPVRLAIFSPPMCRWAQWSQVSHEGLARGRLGLRDLVLVVREDQVDAAGVDVEARAEVAHAHGRALDVPAGAPLPEHRRPAWLAGLGGLPEREVAHVVLLVLVGLDALPRAAAAPGRAAPVARRPATRRCGRRPSPPRSGRHGPPRGACSMSATMSSMCSVARGMTSGVAMPRRARSSRKSAA